MDPIRNPYGPGAGTPPPELAGRAPLLEQARIALERRLIGRPQKSLILVGLRGVGKTVLLNRIDEIATNVGYRTTMLEAAEGRPLRALIAPALRTILYGLDRMEGLSERVKRALRVLQSFAGKFTIAAGGVELGIDPEIGTADSGDLDTDLSQLLVVVGEAAASRKTALALVVDELQYVDEREFASLIVAIHRVTQQNLPVILVGAGLPPVLGLAGRAKSYAERLFDYPTIGPLEFADVADAVQRPAAREGVAFTAAALAEIFDKTQGYPYFVQEWAYQAWNAARASPIERDDVDRATEKTIERLDESFFRVRFDRLTAAEKRYLRAMAQLGPGPHRSGDIAHAYRSSSEAQSVAPLRAKLIAKGMIYAPAHGDTAFTVPLFDEFMKRTMNFEA